LGWSDFLKFELLSLGICQVLFYICIDYKKVLEKHKGKKERTCLPDPLFLMEHHIYNNYYCIDI